MIAELGITIAMPQREIYFFGKLNQSRDFIESDNLQAKDRDFWDNWFRRCSNSNQLAPFTSKTFTPQHIWLFCIRLPCNAFYAGLATTSADKIGRKYPFTLFCKPESHSDLRIDVEFISQYANFFQQIVKTGRHCAAMDYGANTQLILPSPFLHYLNRDSIGSFWLEKESFYYIEHEGLPLCTLFNKLFGL